MCLSWSSERPRTVFLIELSRESTGKCERINFRYGIGYNTPPTYFESGKGRTFTMRIKNATMSQSQPRDFNFIAEFMGVLWAFYGGFDV
nr:unnamed protein product [Callosobruchus chinensis]